MIRLTSNAFNDGDVIPEKYTCNDENISPHLQWDKLPERTISFAILCEDPDASGGIFTHWIIYNIPSDTMELPENIEKKEIIEMGITQGVNDAGYAGYHGPCPPNGPAHRYYFRIYALDTTINPVKPARRDEFLKALQPNVLDEGVLMGKFSR